MNNPGNSTRQNILDNATAMFADYDYTAVSMDRIASSVGIKKASLYFHFKNKEALFEAVFDNVKTRSLELLDELRKKADQGKSLVESLFLFLSGYIEYALNKTVLRFWTRMFILPPAVIGEKDLEKLCQADRQTAETLTLIFKKHRMTKTDAAVEALLRIAGGYISFGTEGWRLPWKEELLFEVKIILRGLLPVKKRSN